MDTAVQTGCVCEGRRGGVDVGVVIVFAVGWGGLVLIMFVARFEIGRASCRERV